MMFNRGFYRFGLGGGCGFFGGWNPLIVIGIGIGILALILWLRSRKNETNKDESYLEVLKDKYIRGEITEEEYLSKKSILERK